MLQTLKSTDITQVQSTTFTLLLVNVSNGDHILDFWHGLKNLSLYMSASTDSHASNKIKSSEHN